MKICPSCSVVFDDGHRNVIVKFDENEERHIKCPGCGRWYFEDHYPDTREKADERPATY